MAWALYFIAAPAWLINSKPPLVVAVLLHRGRGPRSLPDIRLAAKGKSLELTFPRGWFDEHPLTAIDLEQEAEYLEAAGFRLKVS